MLTGSDIPLAGLGDERVNPLFTTNPDDFTGLDTLIRIIPVARPPVPHEQPPRR